MTLLGADRLLVRGLAFGFGDVLRDGRVAAGNLAALTAWGGKRHEAKPNILVM